MITRAWRSALISSVMTMTHIYGRDRRGKDINRPPQCWKISRKVSFYNLANFSDQRFSHTVFPKRTIWKWFLDSRSEQLRTRPRHTCMFFAWRWSIGLFCSDVFPKMWSEFIGCTKSFAASCISSSDLSQFNRAVGNSINSVHKMCTNQDYQKGKYLAMQWSSEKSIFISTAVQKPGDGTMHAKNVTETQIDFGTLLICWCQQINNNILCFAALPYIRIVMTTGPFSRLFSADCNFDYVRAKWRETKLQ